MITREIAASVEDAYFDADIAIAGGRPDHCRLEYMAWPRKIFEETAKSPEGLRGRFDEVMGRIHITIGARRSAAKRGAA